MLLSILLTTQAMAFQYTQKSSYVLQTSFNATEAIIFSNLYLETENPSYMNTNNVFTVQQTEDSTSENDTTSSDKTEKKDGILQRQIDKFDSRYAHPIFTNSQKISRIGTTLWLFGIPTTTIGVISAVMAAFGEASNNFFNFGVITGVIGMGMISTGGGLIVAGNIAAAIPIRKLDIDVPRYGWWLVGGSLLISNVLRTTNLSPQLTTAGFVLGWSFPIGLIWQIRLNRKAYQNFVENNETALYTLPDSTVYDLQYK